MVSTRHKLIIFLTIAALLLLISLRPGFRVEQNAVSSSPVEILIKEASNLNNLLHSRRQTERTEEEHIAVIEAYKRAIDADEKRLYGDEALAAMGRLAEETASSFGKSRYSYSAAEYFRRLSDDYPQSPHRAFALISAARIYELRLMEKEEAARAYAEVVRLFPNSLSAREASANLARLLPNSGPAAGDSADAAEEESEGERVVSSIRNFTGPDYARIVIDLNGPVSYEKTSSGSGKLSLLLKDAKLSPLLSGRNLAVGSDGLLKQIKADEVPDAARINLECPKMDDYAIFTLNNPYRLVIDLHGLNKNETTAPETQASKTSDQNRSELLSKTEELRPSAKGSLSFMRALGLKVKRIVIDPGHGGHDTGAIALNGLIEKDLVLDIALRLRSLIKGELGDVETLMTRDRDRFVALEERTAIANAQSADLFISIHANSSQNPEATGVETYYLSINATTEELEVAARENSSTARNARDLQTLLQQIVLDDKVIESRSFAQSVQRGLVSGLGRVDARAAFNRGVKKAPFIVLIGANMPSVLAEVSFVSNQQQADALKTEEFRQQIAESLFNGVRRYIDALAKK